jgi:hypothetical protein
MKIKLDENLPARLIGALARHGHEADTVMGENLAGYSDAAILHAAGVEQRFLITQDLDFSDTRYFRMYLEASGQHHVAHFHVYYQDEVAVFAIDPIDLIAGTLPRKQLRLVEAWAELHQEELLQDWALPQCGHRPKPIDPLK